MDRYEEIEKIAECAADTLTGQLGFGFMDLQNNRSFFINRDECFPTASVFKILILTELYRQHYRGILSLGSKASRDLSLNCPGSGVIYELRDDVELSLYDYAVLMMIISDNTAADILYSIVGRDNIRANVIDALGLMSTSADLSCTEMIRVYYDLDDLSDNNRLMELEYGDYRSNPYCNCVSPENDQTSPADMVQVLRTLYAGEWVNREASDAIIDIMSRCQTSSRIPALLPPGTRTAHKTGTIDRISNDVGIVYTPAGAYALALLYNGCKAGDEEYLVKNSRGQYGDKILADISLRIYDAYIRG